MFQNNFQKILSGFFYRKTIRPTPSIRYNFDNFLYCKLFLCEASHDENRKTKRSLSLKLIHFVEIKIYNVIWTFNSLYRLLFIMLSARYLCRKAQIVVLLIICNLFYGLKCKIFLMTFKPALLNDLIWHRFCTHRKAFSELYCIFR